MSIRGGSKVKIELAEAGERIKKIRKQHNYSMAAFSKLIGNSSASTVNNWEKGNNLPNKERLEKIAILGNTTVEWILFGDLSDYVVHLIKDTMQENVKNALFIDQLMTLIQKKQLSYYDDLEILALARQLENDKKIGNSIDYKLPEEKDYQILSEEYTQYHSRKKSIEKEQLLVTIEKKIYESKNSQQITDIFITLCHLLDQSTINQNLSPFNDFLKQLSDYAKLLDNKAHTQEKLTELQIAAKTFIKEIELSK